MSKNINLDLKTLPESLKIGLGKIGRYSVAVFCVFLAVIYGFIIFRIATLSTTPQASSSDLASQKAIAPHIDQGVVDQLLNLKDNSVNVQALFDEARDNPFQE